MRARMRAKGHSARASEWVGVLGMMHEICAGMHIKMCVDTCRDVYRDAYRDVYRKVYRDV